VAAGIGPSGFHCPPDRKMNKVQSFALSRGDLIVSSKDQISGSDGVGCEDKPQGQDGIRMSGRISQARTFPHGSDRSQFLEDRKGRHDHY